MGRLAVDRQVQPGSKRSARITRPGRSRSARISTRCGSARAIVTEPTGPAGGEPAAPPGALGRRSRRTPSSQVNGSSLSVDRGPARSVDQGADQLGPLATAVDRRRDDHRGMRRPSSGKGPMVAQQLPALLLDPSPRRQWVADDLVGRGDPGEFPLRAHPAIEPDRHEEVTRSSRDRILLEGTSRSASRSRRRRGPASPATRRNRDNPRCR